MNTKTKQVSRAVAGGTVRNALTSIDTRWVKILHPVILGIGATTVVGRSVVALCEAQSKVFQVMVSADDGDTAETDVVCDMEQAVKRQCDVWYFG